MEEQPTEVESTQPVAPEEPVQSEPKTSSKKRRIIIAAALVLIAIIGAAALLLPKADPVAAPSKKSVTTKKTVATESGPVFSTAKPLSDLALLPKLGDECRSLGNSDCPAASSVKYYQVGQRADGTKLLLITAPSEGPNLIGYETYVATQDKDGKATFYGKSAAYAENFIDKTKVTIDTASFPKEFTFPKNITLKDEPLKRSYDQVDAGYFINGLANIIRENESYTKVASFDGKDYYDVILSQHDSFAVHAVVGTVTSVYAVNYSLDGTLDSDTAPAISWTDASAAYNKDVFTSHGPGCGTSSGFMVLKNVGTDSLTKVGTDSAGEAVYQLPTSSAFFNEVYAKDYASGEYLEAPYKGLSKAEFQAAHGILVSKNGLGQYVAYLNETLIQGGGCAKPVVYLYPTKTTDVAVRVGAFVTKSDPYYNPATGWQHVLAQPSGALTYQGTGYSSLFWEGLGFGNYPSITSGTVVPRAQAVSTIKQQLAAQGLNAQETSDFLAYWQPKLPKTPFVRLSWLSTEELNQLAPLQITPAPQTVIRTFLDFQGLNLPIALPGQHFQAPARNGFTVVEWGGLLR